MKPAIYKVVIKYIAGETSAGEYGLLLDGTDVAGNKKIKNGKTTEIITETVAEIPVKDGEHVLTLKPFIIQKAELMKLLEIQLILSDK
jgi:hypothetical protein